MEHPAPASVTVANYQHTQDGIFGGPVHLARGRQARDPQAKTVTYTVASLDAFETSLHEYLNNPPDNPDHTDCQLSFWLGTSFLVAASLDAPASSSAPQPRFAPHDASHAYSNNHNNANGIHAQQYGTTYQSVADPAVALALDFQQSQASPATANGEGPSNSTTSGKKAEPKVALSVLEALQPTPDPKEKMRKQRAIAKCCVDAIQKCDGYRYSFHNCWNSREDDSFRFSYYCNDSLLNKDRAANGKGAKLGKRATKPVYDCKGVLSIKFSATKQSLDVFYKHVPVHKTYEERAPPPRKDSRRRKFLEENDPETLKKLQSRPKQHRPDLPLESAQKAKKKRKNDDPKSSTSLESDLRAQSLRSLLELIRPDPAPDHLPPAPPPPPPPVVQQQRPVPPPPPPQPIQQQPQVQQQPQPATRKRPRNSCDVCKAKKTKCDGTRPVCQTCIDKKRQCFYSADQLVDERRPSVMPDPPETTRQAQAPTRKLSELERMRKELEDAKARIQELEEEKRRPSTTPAQTPQTAQTAQLPRPQLQHKPQSSETPPQTQSHPQQRDQKQQQRQHSRSHSLHQHQPPAQQQYQHQITTPQNVPSPQQAMQQLQTAAQQLQTPQHQYAPFPSHYGMTAQQNMPRNAAHASQSPNVQQTVQTVQGHQMGVSGMAPTAEQTNPYARGFNPGEWTGYYGYQSAQQQAQEGQWGGVRTAGVFRQV
ncbi:uncharacterized protein N0V89_002065 [Didymosphaeria variabile]|uniref:Zn(2)-C6 fungal-type domain-containing protein n=1 Tax=Didymosphaeria variabile TaxID=1932322 RepID=A0A9W9CE68_9PLEO|nr:uncharacterized protein N0V89_002065 [Didymosphaeria variabile]KAJ4357489.1 hypothetical protein N0V89_002065 [Didymosphaeria variabile]